MSENNSLRSKYLNRVIKEMDVKPNTPSVLIDELCIANGLPHFLYRLNNKRYARFIEEDIYIGHISPIMQRVKDELVDGGKLVLNYDPYYLIDCSKIDTENKGLIFETPLASTKAEEKLLFDSFQSLTPEILSNPQRLHRWLEEKTGIEKEYRQLAYDVSDLPNAYKHFMAQKDLKENGYHGEYPEVNDLFQSFFVEKLDDSHSMGIGNTQSYTFLWSYIMVTAMIAAWMDYRKIYRIADPIAKDFVRMEEIRISKQALSYLPCRNFAIDVSANSDLSGYFDCFFVSVAEYKGQYRIYYEAFDCDGIHATSGMLRSIKLGDGQEEVSINTEYLKEVYSKDLIDESNTFKNKIKADIIPFEQAAANYSNKIFYNYRPTPPSAFKKAEKLILGTIFYLCCANKSTKKTAVKNHSNSGVESKDTRPIEIEDLGVREEQELEAEHQQAIINYNEIVNMGSHSETNRSSGSSGKKRKSPRPHMVNGHQSHVWRGKGENKVRVPIYIRPYWTGAKNNRIITVTTLR